MIITPSFILGVKRGSQVNDGSEQGQGRSVLGTTQRPSGRLCWGGGGRQAEGEGSWMKGQTSDPGILAWGIGGTMIARSQKDLD